MPFKRFVMKRIEINRRGSGGVALRRSDGHCQENASRLLKKLLRLAIRR